MSDQMPDEVWLDGFENKGFWFAWPRPDDSEPHMRYIRADLYEQAGDFDHQGIDPADLGQHFTDAMQALTTRNAVSKAACAQLIAEQAQRAEQAEADRDRLRAALAEIEAERDVLREAVERLSGLPWWRVKTEQEARHG